jgi:hypothetical protein
MGDDDLGVKVVRLFKNDLFGGPPPFQPDKVKKAAKHDKLIDSYIVHLESLLTPGAYSDFLDATEIKRMADIRSCINVSTHPKVKQVEDLYNKVVVRLKSTWNYVQVDKWFKAVTDEVARRQSLDNLNALTCPTDQWSNRNSEGKQKPSLLNCIVAIRYLLEERGFALKDDVWKQYNIIRDDKGKEQYVSVQIDPILREWRNWIYSHKGDMYSSEVMKDAFHQIAKVNEFHSQQEKVRSVTWDGVDRYHDFCVAFGLNTAGEGEDPKTIIKPGQFSMEIPGHFSTEIDNRVAELAAHIESAQCRIPN